MSLAAQRGCGVNAFVITVAQPLQDGPHPFAKTATRQLTFDFGTLCSLMRNNQPAGVGGGARSSSGDGPAYELPA